jgi:hypothetical protein
VLLTRTVGAPLIGGTRVFLQQTWLVTPCQMLRPARYGDWLHPEFGKDHKDNDIDYQYNYEEL